MYKGGTIVAIIITIDRGTWQRGSFREKKKVRFYWSVFKIEIKLAEYFPSSGKQIQAGRLEFIQASKHFFPQFKIPE